MAGAIGSRLRCRDPHYVVPVSRQTFDAMLTPPPSPSTMTRAEVNAPTAEADIPMNKSRFHSLIEQSRSLEQSLDGLVASQFRLHTKARPSEDITKSSGQPTILIRLTSHRTGRGEATEPVSNS